MRRSLLLVALFVGLLFLQTASAASNQGLTWGIGEGQTFTFSVDQSIEMALYTFTTSLDDSYKVIMEIDSLSEIPADIDSLVELPSVDVNIKFENGSAAAELIPISFGFVVPTGNWTLIDELYKDLFGAIPGITWIDDALVYGYSMSFGELGISYDYTVKYLKADGFLYSMNMDMETMFANTTMNFERLGGGLDTMTLILVGGGAGIAIIVIAVAILKMRS